jgi:hypothetical protein
VFAPTLNPKNNFLSVMNADGSAVTPLTHTALSPTFSPIHPSWSPDGTMVSFTYVKTTGTNASGGFSINGIGVAAVDNSAGGGLTVTSGAQTDAFYSSWSADGTQIFYDALARNVTTGANITGAAEYATDAGGHRRATILASSLHAYFGSGFVGPSIDTGSASTYTPVPPTRVLAKTVVGPGAWLNVQVSGGTSPIPAGATAVTLNLTGVTPTKATYLQVYPKPADSSVPLVSNLNLVPGQTAAVAVQVAVSSDGYVRVRNAFGATGVIVDVSGYFTAGGTANQYSPITPVRAVDTTLGVGGTTDITLAPLNTVPGLTPVAVVLNLTAAGPTHDTYLSAYPTQAPGTPPPLVSNLNLPAHATRANLVTVALSVDGKVTLHNAFGSVRTLADVIGFYGTGATGGLAYYPLQPTRFMDTRVGTDTWVGSTAPLGSGATIPIQMRGTATTSAGMITVPAAAAAYVYNLTAVAPTANTYLTAYPFGPTRPLSSTLNAAPATIVPNLAITGTDPNGQIDLYNRIGNTPVLIDLAGYYAP